MLLLSLKALEPKLDCARPHLEGSHFAAVYSKILRVVAGNQPRSVKVGKVPDWLHSHVNLEVN